MVSSKEKSGKSSIPYSVYIKNKHRKDESEVKDVEIRKENESAKRKTSKEYDKLTLAHQHGEC